MAVDAVIAFLFEVQWLALLEHAAEHDVTLFGDVPIYVAHDSADVWAHRSIFDLTPDGLSREVAGVPPDAFSETGQLWRNPLYDWKALRTSGYAWWIRRVQRALDWTPMLRFDHFRGFVEYYAIPADAEDAVRGVWRTGPGGALFEALDEALGLRGLVAEDLGIVGDDVHRLRAHTRMLGMRVLQFGLAEEEVGLHHPDRCTKDSVVYPGTHDNDTCRGWWENLTPEAQRMVSSRLRCELGGREVSRAMVTAALMTSSRIAILSIQDLLALGSECRMNEPGIEEGNWAWRLEEQLSLESAADLRAQLEAAQRSRSSQDAPG
jgi:4-alpha-glucanotransferase